MGNVCVVKNKLVIELVCMILVCFNVVLKMVLLLISVLVWDKCELVIFM